MLSTTTAPPLSAGLMTMFLFWLRFLRAEFSSLVKLWNLLGGTFLVNRSISFCLQNNSSAITGGGYHLEGSLNWVLLNGASGPWALTFGLVRSSSSSGKLSKKSFLLILIWNLFRSSLRSPNLGSPGVGQNFIPFANTAFSWSDRV